MKALSNKSKSKKTSGSSVKDTPAIKDAESKPRYSVETISNGYIVEKSWSDKDGRYHCVKKYHETNPLEEESE